MSFYLKKFISLFLKPMNICFILLLIGLYYLCRKQPDYKKAKIFLISATVWFFVISWSPLSSLYILPFEKAYDVHLEKQEDKNYQYIAVLSSGHADNNSIPTTEQIGRQSLRRLIEGIRLQKMYPEAKLIFSGFKYLNNIRETGDVTKDAAIVLGADPERILVLRNTRDTMEEAVAVKKLVNNDEVLLVTSASHMVRSMALFKGQNINVHAAPSEFHIKNKISIMSTLNSGSVYNTERAIHESVGYIWGWIRGKY